MHGAFSRLKWLLDGKGLTTADLVRRIADHGDRVNAKSVYRLADPEEPLEKVDLRVVGAVCAALEIGIGDLLTFEEPTATEEFDRGKQARMDALLARHGAGGNGLSAAELTELRMLIEEAEAVARRNAHRLAKRLRRLQHAPARPSNGTHSREPAREPAPERDRTDDGEALSS